MKYCGPERIDKDKSTYQIGSIGEIESETRIKTEVNNTARRKERIFFHSPFYLYKQIETTRIKK